jgi:hypothetical protein
MSVSELFASQDRFPELGITEYEIQLLEEEDQNKYWATPEEAKARLEALGYDYGTFEGIVSERKGSHEVRASAVIALGMSPRRVEVLVANLMTLDVLAGRVTLGNSRNYFSLTTQNRDRQTQAVREAIERLPINFSTA